MLLLGIRRYPAFLSILIGTLAGALVAIIFQQPILITFANDMSLSAPFAAVKSIWVAMGNGFVLESPYPEINQLFSGGGMSSMLSTVWLILGAMSFGAMMDYGGFNQRLISPIIQRLKSDGATIATVMLTSIGFNIVAGDQYIAIVLPARMFMLDLPPARPASRNAGHGRRELGHGDLAVDSLELVRRLHVGHAGRVHIRLLSILLLQPTQPAAGVDLRLCRHQRPASGAGRSSPRSKAYARRRWLIWPSESCERN